MRVVRFEYDPDHPQEITVSDEDEIPYVTREQAEAYFQSQYTIREQAFEERYARLLSEEEGHAQVNVMGSSHSDGEYTAFDALLEQMCAGNQPLPESRAKPRTKPRAEMTYEEWHAESVRLIKAGQRRRQ